jgi:tetratricopeptide (TPR) repeat protein
MTDPYKTVFISYNPERSRLLALAVFHALRERNCDVFMDTEILDVKRFDFIKEQVAARAHFLLLLTPGSLIQGDIDWWYHQINCAIKLKRHIMPIMAYGFRFEDAKPYLVGHFARLKRFNSITLPLDQFDEVMARQAKRFVRQSVSGAIIPATPDAESYVRRLIEEISSRPAPTQKELIAEQYLNQGIFQWNRGDLAGAVTSYTEALRLKPNYPEAYFYRGRIQADQGDCAGAIADYTEAMRITPNFPDLYRNRGLIYEKQHKWAEALADYTEAIRIEPRYVPSYLNRGMVHYGRGNWEGAIINYSEVIRIDPQNAAAYFVRAVAYQAQGDLEKAIADFNEVIRLKPRDWEAYNNRGVIYEKQGHYWKAFVDYNSALRKNPKSSLVKNNRSKVLKKIMRRWGWK